MPTWGARFLSSSSRSGNPSPPVDVPTPDSSTSFPSLPRLLGNSGASRPSRAPNSHARSKSHHHLSSTGRPTSAGRPTVGLRRSEGDLLAAAEADARRNMSLAGRNEPAGNNRMHPADVAQPMTGQCMCCDSTVRWPSNISTFRCVTCGTVNDLKPVKIGSSDSAALQRPPPVSVEGVKTIIDSSIAEFLEGCEAVKSTSPSDSGPSEMFSQKQQAVTSRALPGVEAPQDSNDLKLPPARSPPPPPSQPTDVSPTVALPTEGSRLLEGQSANNPPNQMYKELCAKMFRPLEDYLVMAFENWECLNWSFLEDKDTTVDNHAASQPTEQERPHKSQPIKGATELLIPVTDQAGEKEALMLTVGRVVRKELGRDGLRKERDRGKQPGEQRLTLRSPGINWSEVNGFYDLIINAGKEIFSKYDALSLAGGQEKQCQSRENEMAELDLAVEEARINTTRVLLKVTENLLKRPGRPLKRPEDTRFLLIILANPLLYPGSSRLTLSKTSLRSNSTQRSSRPSGAARLMPSGSLQPPPRRRSISRDPGNSPGNHSGILKRIFGLLSNLPNECHHYLISWFSVMPEDHFRRLVELGGGFTTYRISRQDGRRNSRVVGLRGKLLYSDDWQIKATARVMSLLFSANNNALGRRRGPEMQGRGQIVPSNAFYNMRLDYCDLITDFDAWESKTAKFCFCQYPFFLSMGAKIQILEHDARRQMELQARNAFITNISNRTALSQYMILKVRRECLVEDSLKGISESAGTLDDIKKGLKVEFVGEDGIDAGGLKKEWFLLVARDVFDPNYGLFIYDEDSQYCYFNPYSFESSEEFYLVGVLLGLAIYNSTILDIALPRYVFKKLIHFTPSWNSKGGVEHKARPPFRRTLEDLAMLRPALAKGLQQLLDFEGDVQETFCRDFVAETERFGDTILVPLCPNGENRPVTNANRKEFVELYIKYILDTSVVRQFEPFKRGFYFVCGGNALSLFGPEEIELLVRGSDEPLDVQALKAVAIYDGWSSANPAETDVVVRWFWGFFEKLSPSEQRMLLSFITGSDRIPAMGATNLTIKVVCLGGDSDRFPVARTCFNQICLWKYKRREKLEKLLWRAVTESEGFGLK